MLAKQLGKLPESEYSVRFLTRKKSKSNEYVWDVSTNYIDPEALVGVNCIIHLAGASIGGARWTDKRKQIILSSRVEGAKLIFNELQKRKMVIETFISASAIGYYGSKTTNEIFDEKSPKGNDFLSKVCFEWEAAAEKYEIAGIAKRVAIVRTGIVLDKIEGALSKIIMPVKLGIGAGLGTGKQFMPWIHIQDLIGIYKFILDNKTVSGIFNAVSPQHVTNNEFTNTVAKTISKSVIFPNIPEFVIKLFLGEMSVILLEGSKVSSEKIVDAGYQFQFEELQNALSNLIKE